jgi:hypothetical protein
MACVLQRSEAMLRNQSASTNQVPGPAEILPTGPFLADSWMRRTVHLPFTSVASVFAALVFVAACTMDINVIDLNLRVLERIERSELDELLSASVLVLVAFGVDQVRAARVRRRENGLKAEEVRVVHVTMRTVQDIVGNCLTELQLLRMEAEGLVPTAALSMFDESIRVATSKLTALEALKTFAERKMAMGGSLSIEH